MKEPPGTLSGRDGVYSGSDDSSDAGRAVEQRAWSAFGAGVPCGDVPDKAVFHGLEASRKIGYRKSARSFCRRASRKPACVQTSWVRKAC